VKQKDEDRSDREPTALTLGDSCHDYSPAGP
jgi:hypothetical protein